MRSVFFLVLFLISTSSHAGCSQIASIRTETVYIDIGTGGCATSKDMITYATKKSEDKEFPESKAIPFLSECTPTKDGFKCRSKGKTPLAGAAYRRIMFGRSSNSCDEDDALGEKYICIRGCGRSIVPEYLEGYDGSC